MVGFDDLKIARWAGPALTTIRVPIAEMAEQAVHVVLNLAQDRAPAFSRDRHGDDARGAGQHRCSARIDTRESFVHTVET